MDLKKVLVRDPEQRPLPLTFEERFQMIIPENNEMQMDLDLLHEFAVDKQLIVKEKKTQIMKINFSRSLDFPVELRMNGFKNNIEVITETKLLGIVISNNLKWDANTEYLCKKAYKKLWVLRRLKALKVDPSFILEVYTKEVRSVLELAVPAWHSGISKKLAIDIERVQKVAVGVILGKSLPYSVALAQLKLDPLYVRREALCRKFAKKTSKSRHADIFTVNNQPYQTRHKERFLHPICRTSRFYNSPVNYLTRILNAEK